jgi:hypothetical protein
MAVEKAAIEKEETPRPGRKNVTEEMNSKAFPFDYPGLRLGCITDPTGGYCAMKRAAVPSEPLGRTETACDFFLSCCYAQYDRMHFDGLPPVEEIETACPGAKAALRGPVCTV